MTEALPSRSDGASISDAARALKLREKRAASARLLTGYTVAQNANNVETSGPPPTLLELMSSLVTAWRNLAAYPPGHPARASALATAHTRLRASLAAASPLVLGISRDALVSGGKKLEASHVRAFARALYRRNGGVLRFEEDVEPRELETFLALLGDTGPARDRPLTVEELDAAGITHIHVSAIDYSALVTTSDLDEPGGDDGSLWDGLLQTLLAGQGPDQLDDLRRQRLPLIVVRAREPVLAAALRVLATEDAASAHLARLAAALPPADVLRGLRRLAQEQGQLSSHALRMAQALAEAHEDLPPTEGLPEPPADFAAMAALFREEDVDRYNPEDHRALLAQKPTVDLAAIAVDLAADPDAFGPDSESDDAIERRVVTTLLDMTAVSPDVVRPLVLGRLRDIFVRALQASRFAQAISMIRAIRDLAADPSQAERRRALDEFVEHLADAPTLAALVAASRQPGGPPFVQVQSLVLALGASATHGLLEALAAEPDRARRLRLIELAASLGPAIVPETRRLLADSRWYVVRNMVLLLRRVHDKSAMSEILRCADHPDLRVRLEAIRALFAFDTKVPRDLLARTINHPDPRLAEAAVLLSGQHGITQATDLLVEILLRWDFLGRRRSLRLKALRALADLADPAVLPRLDRFFRERPFPLVALEERRAAYRLLGSYDQAARAPYLARGEKSRDSLIRDICRALVRASAAK
jgi:hypothetical protein